MDLGFAAVIYKEKAADAGILCGLQKAPAVATFNEGRADVSLGSPNRRRRTTPVSGAIFQKAAGGFATRELPRCWG